MTGPDAPFGSKFKKAYDLALEEINAKGGVNGKKVVAQFEQVISEARYEKLRMENHGQEAPLVEVTKDMVAEIRTKYRILLERDKPKNN